MKIINEFTYKIIIACKESSHDYLKDFLKKELMVSELQDRVIYYYLLETVFKIYDKNIIENIFKHKLSRLYLDNVYIKGRKNFNYEDLWKLLYSEIMELKIREKGKDLYKISVNDKLLSYKEYDNYIIENNKKKVLQKQKNK